MTQELITGLIIGASIVGFVWACVNLFKADPNPQGHNHQSINEAFRNTFKK